MYDLDDVADRMSVYKQVLSHGVAEDVCRFIRVEELACLWGQMILPSYVRDVWGPWLHQPIEERHAVALAASPAADHRHHP